jgi:peptidoglycan/xylan/chitin deacetylase (PgdA/CDA1 family)
VVLGAMLTALALALLVNGFTEHAVGRSSTVPAVGAASGLDRQRPILDLSGPAPRSVPLPAKTVALTFDDGPDPEWTPRILDVLRRQGVPATFFVVGAEAAKYPELVRAEVAAGHQIGAHTFTHTDLGAVSPARARIELGLTQTALAGAAGLNTHLLRLPYSAAPDEATGPELAAARHAAALGYLLVFATQDSEDWRQPGAGTIVARSTPAAGQGGVVLLHDGGGDRRQTVEAVDRLITRLRAEGYQFATVSDLAGLPRTAAVRPADRMVKLQGAALLLALAFASGVTRFFGFLLVPIAILALARGFAVAFLARRHARRPRPAIEGAAGCGGVSVIVPAYNEEIGIAATIRSLLASDYPDFEVIVVDDGSTDGTAAVVAGIEDGRVRLIRQTNSGKPIALNAGVAAARHDLLVMVDGDTVFEPDTIRNVVGPLRDPAVGAVSGNTKVGNRRGLIGRWQHIEYVIGFNLDRRMHDVLQCMPTVPGRSAPSAGRHSNRSAV